ncbi:MAG: hypothetical protein AAB873_01315 [Patescibacteria group bacterium]
MKKIIYNLRQKPERTRRHIMHVFMALFGFVLVSFWVFNLGRTFSDPGLTEKAKQDLKPFTVLKDNLLEGYGTIGEKGSVQDSSVVE